MVLISSKFALLFGVRYELGLYGNDPCDEWSIEDVLGLPDGLYYHGGQICFECRSCESLTEWPGTPDEFEPDAYENMCGGSPRCCP